MANDNQNSYHHGNLRQELLEQAEKHLIQGGIAELSLRALAREIGVSQTAPYRHFKDKNALLAALASEGFQRLLENIKAAEAETSPEHALLLLGMEYIHFAQHNPEVFRLMFGPVLLPRKLYSELFAAGREAFHSLQRIIERGVKQGIFHSNDIGSLTHTAWAGVHGVATLTLDHGDSFGYYRDLEQQAENSLLVMIAGLKTARVPDTAG